MIQARGLTKRYGNKVAVENVSFDVKPGSVTGFLGPNGAGKSTTMRLILGLDRPTSGTVTVCNKYYREHSSPLSVAGALLDAKGVHPGRSARSHLRSLAATHGISNERVEEVLELTGLQNVARKRVGGFSLGMGQRLGIAGAILGDPQVLLLDEPVNGLDPEGVVWVRKFVRAYAAQGRAVLLSSHLMSEMAQTADRVIVLGKGRVIADADMDEIVQRAGDEQVRVVSPEADKLARLIETRGKAADRADSDSLVVHGLSSVAVGAIAAENGVVLHELTPMKRGLEEAYLELTRDEVEYRSELADIPQA
jgi:ABC-2 type transport system ATP-binding protein